MKEGEEGLLGISRTRITIWRQRPAAQRRRGESIGVTWRARRRRGHATTWPRWCDYGQDPQ